MANYKIKDMVEMVCHGVNNYIYIGTNQFIHTYLSRSYKNILRNNMVLVNVTK